MGTAALLALLALAETGWIGAETAKCVLDHGPSDDQITLVLVDGSVCYRTVYERSTWNGRPIDVYFYETPGHPDNRGPKPRAWNRMVRTPAFDAPDQSGAQLLHVKLVQRKGKWEETSEATRFEVLPWPIVRSVEASPRLAHPGDTVELGVSYLLKEAPAGGVEVTERREVLLGETSVLATEDRVRRANGVHESTRPLRIPASAPAGTYTLRVRLEAGGAASRASATFELR